MTNSHLDIIFIRLYLLNTCYFATFYNRDLIMKVRKTKYKGINIDYQTVYIPFIFEGYPVVFKEHDL